MTLHDTFIRLANTIESDRLRLSLIAKLDRRTLSNFEQIDLSAALTQAPEPIRTIVRSVLEYVEFQKESQ